MMGLLALLPLALSARPAAATPLQEPPTVAVAHDTAGLGRTTRTAREALARMPDIWRLDADSVTWLFNRGDSAWFTERRRGRDYLVPIQLPSSTVRANMSVDLDGRRYAMVVLPLSGTDEERARLLVHEATHTFQPHMLPGPGATEAGEGGDLLDGEQGRLWLFLELRALGRAITASGDARRDAARDALLFRAVRDSIAHPIERARLDSLDLMEGVPSYTAWRLTLTEPTVLAARLDSAPQLATSWVRGISYETGPAYGYLLDALAGEVWRQAFIGGERLPAILATVLGSTPFALDLRGRARLYGYDAISRAERARAVANARRLDSLRTRFVTSTALRLIPGSLRISFDPGGQFPIGSSGTVMMNFRWAADDGAELVATGGALVSPTWNWFQVPLGNVQLDAGTLGEQRVIEGDGWKLTLPAGWRVTRVAGRAEVRPPASQ